MASKQPERKRVIIIGAGAGGIATAARLAKAGLEVIVFEKNDFVGGRCNSVRKDGYRFEEGPIFFSVPRLYHETFSDLDTSLEEQGIELLRSNPNYHIWFPDGHRFQPTADMVPMKAELERIEPDGMKRYLAWLADARKSYELALKVVFKNQFAHPWELLRPQTLLEILQARPWLSMDAHAKTHFESEKLQIAFSWAAWLFGASPSDTSSLHALLWYTEVTDGMLCVKDGLQRVFERLADVGRAMGAEYRLSTSVDRVLVAQDGLTITGVQLESGERVYADAVVVNADIIYAYNKLLPQTASVLKEAARLNKLQTSIGTISFYWGLSRAVPELASHNMFIPERFTDLSGDSYIKDTLPPDLLMYIHVPTRDDPAAGPEGCDGLTVHVIVGNLQSKEKDKKSGTRTAEAGSDETEIDWDNLVKRAREAAIKRISESTNEPEFGELIRSETIYTPQTWVSKYNTNLGSIVGLTHSFTNILHRRPVSKSPVFRNMYLVGSDTQPGVGLPLVLASAKFASTHVLRDMEMAVPWAGHVTTPPRGMGSWVCVGAVAAAFLAVLSMIYS